MGETSPAGRRAPGRGEGSVSGFEVEVRVTPRAGILDPEGETIGRALRELGHAGIGAVRSGRLLRLRLEAADAVAARREAVAMCEALLANPVIEEYAIEVAPVARTGTE